MSIGTDCSSVINRIKHTPTVPLFSNPMHQVIKEIRKITSDLDIKKQLFKIKACQERVKCLNDLSFVERENVECDLADKALFRSVCSDTHPFPFGLSSMNLSTRHDKIMSTHLSLYHHASLTSVSKYLAHKLKLSRLDVVDCKSRIIDFKKIPTHLHTWASKSLSNFSGSAYRMN